MHFADNIDYPPLLRRPVVFLPVLAILFLALLRADAAQWAMVEPVLHAIGSPEGAAANAAAAAALTALIGANVYFILGLKLRWQVYVVWIELALLLVLFFVSFDLSWEFIRRKLWLLLSKGLVTTLYI